MKTTHRFMKIPAILVAGLFALAFLFQPSEASAKDNWNKHRGYQKHGYNMPPGQAKKYYGSKYYSNRYYYQPAPRYVTYEGRRGYWQENNGVRIFINLN